MSTLSPRRKVVSPGPTSAGLGEWPSYDAVSGLTVYVVLLFAIPANLVVGQLGAAGTPAQIFGLGIFVWWALSRLAGGAEPRAPRPVRTALLVYMAAILASYLAAALRPIDGVELRAADRGLLSVCAWAGVFLLASEGPRSFDRMDTLLRRLVTAAGGLALLGVAQFVTKSSLITFIQIPGLSLNGDLVGVLSRNGYARPAGTATHPIEFGVVLAMVLPLALHYAFVDAHRGRLRRWFPVGAIALAIPISVSRSAILAAAVVLMFLMPTWNRRRQLGALAATLLTLAVVYVTVPGLLGMFRSLFLGIQNDPSALSRTGSYELAWSFISRAPLFGRGVSTFLPSYRILDNQYLGSAIETGLVGVTALVALIVTGIVTARRVRRLSVDPVRRDLAQSLAAAFGAAGLSFGTFDALGFPIVAGVTFFLLGCVSGLLRLELAGEVPPDRRDRQEAGSTIAAR